MSLTNRERERREDAPPERKPLAPSLPSTLGRKMITSGTWMIFPLTIEGSYARDLERPAAGPADSFQYWIGPSLGYDIRTFSIDKTIRLLELNISGKKEKDLLPTILGIARRTYEGIIEREVRIDVSPSDTVETLIHRVESFGLFPRVEWTVLNFPLWLPENIDYKSLST